MGELFLKYYMKVLAVIMAVMKIKILWDKEFLFIKMELVIKENGVKRVVLFMK